MRILQKTPSQPAFRGKSTQRVSFGIDSSDGIDARNN
jgi:hypothetical protein